MEDSHAVSKGAARYLLHHNIDLSVKCEDPQNRLSRNNIRIFQIPEGSEGNDTIGFVKQLIKETLKLPSETDIKIERAHRAFGT